VTLGEFLKGAAQDRGPWNCSTLPADWCVALGYPDFAAKWRNIVGDAEAEEAGADGLLPLWDEGIGGAVPRAPSDALQAGDIAVLALGPLETGAIWTGERWAIRRVKGLHFAAAGQLATVAAWRPI